MHIASEDGSSKRQMYYTLRQPVSTVINSGNQKLQYGTQPTPHYSKPPPKSYDMAKHQNNVNVFHNSSTLPTQVATHVSPGGTKQQNISQSIRHGHGIKSGSSGAGQRRVSLDMGATHKSLIYRF